MEIIETKQYQRTKRKILKRFILKESDIENTLNTFKKDKKEPSLHYKKMRCKRDKNRYSIRILNTQYRILMTVEEDIVILVCVCDHDDYDIRNRDC